MRSFESLPARIVLWTRGRAFPVAPSKTSSRTYQHLASPNIVERQMVAHATTHTAPYATCGPHHVVTIIGVDPTSTLTIN
jgi:hypothetical protein